ncbi:non-ribosomal peptide synthetase [Luteolibacter marinus]|uniref:non-ribosomal peptide synthetase n=1 Tax=Luteolibacter marinus TaxID=2776705 RepID=UPI001867AF2A|nr:non-ribosomal peptide synthetase [Luteolibacter marinus]
MSDSPHLDDSTPAPADGAGDVLAFPASVAQQVFWYLECLQPGVTAFNIPMRFRLDGPLDADLLEQTLRTIIDRHEALRTHFEEDGGELLQVIVPDTGFELARIDLTGLPGEQQEAEVVNLSRLEAERPFDLATGPAFRAELVRLSANRHHLHMSVHHALFDGSSMTVLTEEIAAIYQALHEGRACPLDPLPIQYGDYSVWQREHLESPALARQMQYWKQKLAGMNELDLPTDRPRPAAKSWRGELVSALLPRDLTGRLQAIAARNGATLFHLMLAAYKVLLHRYSGSSDIAVGSPITGRTRPEMEPLIGVFINSLVLRTDLGGDPSFETLLGRVRDSALEAVEHQDLPFEYLVRELRPERDASRNPLFQVNFTHQRAFSKAGSFNGVEMTPLPAPSPGTIFDLHFFVIERAEGWRLSCDYSTDLFNRATAERMIGHYQRLLEELADDPSRPISSLQILTADEEQRITGEWPGTTSPYPRDASLAELFVETANRHAATTAIEFGDESLSYAQLRAAATTVAKRLIDSGVNPGDPVILCAKPSLETITGLIGIVLSGGSYVPLDPDFPDDRIKLLLDESGARHGLCGSGLRDRFGAWPGTVVELGGTDSPSGPIPLLPTSAEHPACLLFTSGSTGKPKGVLVPQRGIIRLVRGCDYIDLSADDVFLQAAPLSFDASTFEIWAPLLNGGKLVIPRHGTGLDEIAATVRHKQVTTLWLTAGLFQVMIEEHADDLRGLRYLLAGGDVLSVAHVRRAIEVLPGTQLINGYGPTENATFTTCHAITAADCERPSIPIGRPIANTSVFILDESGRPVATGVPGELHTGGDGLAVGYLGDEALTAAKFITHPQFGRLYRTGDLCRWLPDGTIEFTGRIDHQVKVRGFRVEPGEIEAALSSHPEVRQVKVAVRGDSAEDKRILAWILLEQGSLLDGHQLKSWLSARLPAFLRPDAVIPVGSFPVNANGKIDAAALPEPTVQPSGSKAFAAPIGETELKLASIWRELLEIQEISRDDDFFALGGHSLMALRMFSRINREFGRSLPLSALLTHPTIARLGAALSPSSALEFTGGKKGQVVTLRGGGGPPLFCIHGGDGGVLFYRSLADRMPGDFPLYAIEALALGRSEPIQEATVEETAADYVRELLAMQPQGPIRLAGYSFGGVVAHEMACLLTGQGREVEFLGLFDTHNPAAPCKRLSLPGRLGAFWQQQDDLPLPAKLERLRERIAEGIGTHRRVKEEVAAAMSQGPAEAHSDLRRVQVREENWRAMEAYHPHPFPGAITLFKAQTPSDKVEWPDDYGWSELAGRGLEIIPVPGQHLTLFDEENVEALSAALASALHVAVRHGSDINSTTTGR